MIRHNCVDHGERTAVDGGHRTRTHINLDFSSVPSSADGLQTSAEDQLKRTYHKQVFHTPRLRAGAQPHLLLKRAYGRARRQLSWRPIKFIPCSQPGLTCHEITRADGRVHTYPEWCMCSPAVTQFRKGHRMWMLGCSRSSTACLSARHVCGGGTAGRGRWEALGSYRRDRT